MVTEEDIKKVLKKSISNFFLNKKVKVIHPLDFIFPSERRIRSLIGGLETSMGTTLWEPILKLFAKNNGYEIKDVNKVNENCYEINDFLIREIASFKNKKDADNRLSHQEFFKNIKSIIKKNKTKKKMLRKRKVGVDIWLKKDNKEILIDVKTTQINSGDGPKFNENLLKWYTYRALAETKSDVICFIFFPFNPHHPKDFWAKEGGKSSPLIHREEVKMGDELWNEISGMNNTTAFILNAFKSLGKDNFSEEFKSIFYKKS